MPSTACRAGVEGRCSGAGKATPEVGSQARRKAFIWIFAAMFLLLFSRKFLIPPSCHQEHRTGCCPHSLCLLHAGSSGSFFSVLFCFSKPSSLLGFVCPKVLPWHYLSGTLKVLHSALKLFHIVSPFTALSLSAKNS